MGKVLRPGARVDTGSIPWCSFVSTTLGHACEGTVLGTGAPGIYGAAILGNVSG